MQREILERRGLRRGRNSQIVNSSLDVRGSSKVTISRIKKTPLMRAIEERWNQPIEELLDTNLPIEVIGNKLGVNQSTVSLWRLRLGLRERKYVEG